MAGPSCGASGRIVSVMSGIGVPAPPISSRDAEVHRHLCDSDTPFRASRRPCMVGGPDIGEDQMGCRSLIAACVAAALLAMAAAADAQDLSKYPDWSGQWRRPDNVAPSWDPTKPPGRGQQAPLTPEYQAIFESVLKDRATGGLTGDPTGLCMPHGMPRMMVAIY